MFLVGLPLPVVPLQSLVAPLRPCLFFSRKKYPVSSLRCYRRRCGDARLAMLTCRRTPIATHVFPRPMTYGRTPPQSIILLQSIPDKHLAHDKALASIYQGNSVSPDKRNRKVYDSRSSNTFTPAAQSCARSGTKYQLSNSDTEVKMEYSPSESRSPLAASVWRAEK